ncbi:MAG: exonuclease SbcCD subunit D [Nanoarchaeota archaeon]|nr:exonuclease SbcCD subunit D [Nanoarchaeota archaeon]
MRIVIFGDTHLGRRNFKIKEREADFENAFTQVIDYALKNSEAVIHTGDLFDIGTPSIDTILSAIKQLKRLKEKNIPFFVIAGSHDISVEGSFLKVLDRIGLVFNVTDKKYYEESESKVVLKGEQFKGLFVAGLYARKSNINEVLEYLKPELPVNLFKVFVFHHFIEDINPLFGTVKKSCLPKGFDLYVSGHWHDFFESKIKDKKILYPGSTESCDLRDMQNDKKGFIVYDTENNNYEFVNIRNRKSVIINVDCNNKSAEEVVELLFSKIQDEEGAMLFFILKGRLKSGVKSEINKQLVYDKAREKGYLFCKIYTGKLENPEERQTEITKKSIEEIEKEFFHNKGFNNKESLLAQNLIKQLGNGFSNSKLDELVNEVIILLEGDKL